MHYFLFVAAIVAIGVFFLIRHRRKMEFQAQQYENQPGAETIRQEIEKENRLLELYPEWSDAIRRKSQSLGMPLDLFLDVHGEPDSRREDVERDRIMMECIYENRPGSHGYGRAYKFENGVLVGWKDL